MRTLLGCVLSGLAILLCSLLLCRASPVQRVSECPLLACVTWCCRATWTLSNSMTPSAARSHSVTPSQDAAGRGRTRPWRRTSWWICWLREYREYENRSLGSQHFWCNWELYRSQDTAMPGWSRGRTWRTTFSSNQTAMLGLGSHIISQWRWRDLFICIISGLTKLANHFTL